MARIGNRARFQRIALPACATAVIGLAGCSGGDTKGPPLTAEQFASRAGVPQGIDGGRSYGQPVDRAGAVPYDTSERPALTTPEIPAQPSEANPNPDQRTSSISPAVNQAVSRPSEAGQVRNSPGATRPTSPAPTNLLDPSRITLNGPGSATRPGTQPVAGAQATGIFFVVMEVNGQPIYSDKVLQVLDRPLAAEAKQNNRENFRAMAEQYIGREVLKFMNNELEIAAAEKALDKDDKQLARAVTMQWRQKQITAAGGSLELARRKARQDGWDFDELVEQQNRLHMVQLYYQKHISPLTKVTASDVRTYYQKNMEKEFSTPGRSRFRIIRIDPKNPRYGSKEDALAAAEMVVARAKTEDFATLAKDSNINDDDSNRDRGGLVGKDGWVEAGSFAVDEVEKEVTSLKPGQVTGVIQARNMFFIAKLEDIQNAKVRPFEDMAVQEQITEKLRAQQIQAMRERHVRDLQMTAVTERKPGAMKALLEIVMQRYDEWAANKG